MRTPDQTDVAVSLGVVYSGIIRKHELLPTQRCQVRARYEEVIHRHLQALKDELGCNATVSYIVEDHR